MLKVILSFHHYYFMLCYDHDEVLPEDFHCNGWTNPIKWPGLSRLLSFGIKCSQMLKFSCALLLQELDDAKNDLRKAHDKIRIAKDEVEDLKLERVRKDMEAQLCQSLASAVEDFKKFGEKGKLKSKCALGF